VIAVGAFCSLESLPVAEFIDPDWGDKVNSGTGLPYRPARLLGLAGQYDNPMPVSTLSVSSATGYKPIFVGCVIWSTVHVLMKLDV
jgi:hypothetical protein